jgi:hypothetical protein
VALAEDLADFRRKRMGTTLAITGGTVAGLITAGRRECWGSQTSGAGGHRNNAVPFCFVLVTFPATTTLTSAALPEESQRHQASSAPGSRYCRRVSADRSKRFCNRRGASSANPDCSHCQQESESRLQRRRARRCRAGARHRAGESAARRSGRGHETWRRVLATRRRR